MKRLTTDLSPDRREARNKAREFTARTLRYDDRTLNDVIMLSHGNNSEVAIAISGTSDKKSPKYKAALRNVQRYRAKGTGKQSIANPGSGYKERLLNILRGDQGYIDTRAGEQTRGAKVELKGTVKISKIVEERKITVNMDADKLSRFLGLAVVDNQAAYGIFTEGTNYPPLAEVYSDATITITT